MNRNRIQMQKRSLSIFSEKTDYGLSLRQVRHYDAPITRDTYANFTNLAVALRTIFEIEMDVPDPLSRFFNEANSSDAAEYHQGDGSFGDVPEYKGKIEYEDSDPLWRITYQHVQYAKGMSIERTLRDDAKFPIIRNKTRQFGMSFQRTVARHRASIFNNSFDGTNFPGADSVALCSTSHPYSPTDATVQSNYLTLALTHDNVVTARETMMSFKDPKGNEYPVVPDVLVTGVGLMDEAEVITKSMAKSGTANNDANTNQGLMPVVSPLITDSNAWWLVDSRLATLYLNWYWHTRPEFMADPTSEFDLTWRYRGYTRYSYGWDDYRWILGSNPS